MAHSIHFIETISLSPYRIPYNSWITSAQHRCASAQQLICKRTTAVVRFTTASFPRTDIISSNNFHYILRQLLILFSIAYPITYDRLSYYLRLLILLLTSAYPITYNNRRYLLAAVILFAFVWHRGDIKWQCTNK